VSPESIADTLSGYLQLARDTQMLMLHTSALIYRDASCALVRDHPGTPPSEGQNVPAHKESEHCCCKNLGRTRSETQVSHSDFLPRG